MKIANQAKDYTGQVFGKLTVICPIKRDTNGCIMWGCVCKCGKTTTVRGSQLKLYKSCGCEMGNTKLKRGQAAFNRLYDHYQTGAKQRNLTFELTKEDFKLLTKQKCFYCGEVPNQYYSGKTYYGNYKYNGIDRIDNNIGYELSNCVACCKICNYMKRTLEQTCFINKCKQIAETQCL